MEDNSSNSTQFSNCTDASGSWIKPNDVMKSRKMKSRRNALNARFVSLSPVQSKYIKMGHSPRNPSPNLKRNPFKCLQKRNDILHSESPLNENSSDCSLFNILTSQVNPRKSESQESYNFLNILSENHDKTNEKERSISSEATLLVDWSLKSRIRFSSSKPLQWKHTFKSSEEASGTTGFVRCLNSETEMRDGRTLDTSANAQFYQCCLVWQHPNFPHLTLFPREKQKLSGPTGIYGSDKKIMNALHSEWGESLRSLYQLLRVRQCPFFYVCGHSFTCLFRATGAAGFSQTHALITPTTRGFRDAMKKEGVEFSMPLFEKNQSGESLEKDDETDFLSGEIDHEEPTDFLETLGLEASQFPSLNQRAKTQGKQSFSIDGSPQSLVFIGDMELHGLINFLLNCGSCITTTGILAGVPPTLLSPVAFHGGCLKSLKVNGSSVRSSSGETLFCVDIQGPILPTAVLLLSSLLASSQDKFSASLTPLASTLPFCYVSPAQIGSAMPMPMAFANEGLIDCGLGKDVREILCKDNDDRGTDLPPTYRQISYDNDQYVWSDKL